ncbi:hypothetical protein [Tenggerimyces flavus]|uniref:Uncharacterized protein n=1 Tax=Tenggerimyces flavus TaxID=1708749 RepID=A0ABV7YBC6_9ACTN|nr:hypothetical protein [Tenggerimyces flavus]MBM7788909.1 hypothetical protein [Tenggerimyces flavus]
MKLIKRVAVVLAGIALLAGAGAGPTAAAPQAESRQAVSPQAVSPQAAPEGGAQAIAPPADLLKLLETKRLPSDVKCWKFKMTVNGWDGVGCFEWNGDDLWVKDSDDNGKNFRIHAEITGGRHSYCNAPGGPGWSQCNYNYDESACVRLHGYHPPHAAGLHSSWAGWVRVSNGKSCQ